MTRYPFLWGIRNKISNFELAAFNGMALNYLVKDKLGKQSLQKDIIFEQEILKLCYMKDFDIDQDKIKELSIYSRLVSKDGWKNIYYMECKLISEGKYLKAYQVRKFGEIVSVQLYDRGVVITNKVFLIWSLVHTERIHDAVLLAEKMYKKAKMYITKCKLLILITLLKGSKDIENGIENIFDLDVKNQNIVLYGPLSQEMEKFKEEKIIVINNIKKKKSHIYASFYNGGTMNVLNNIVDRSFFNECEYLVFHRIKYPYQKELLKEKKCKLTWTVDYLMEPGLPNMLPNMLFQLLSGNVGSLYVTGFNLYMSAKIYKEDYMVKDDEKTQFNSVKESFSIHNIISQYNFIEFLYKNKYFKCDSCLEEILDNGIEWYLKGLERIQVLG